ncbi:hypothetical protein HAX54_003285 [Datura stramonium]|uniref:RNase H type-1 domain-containing protein n=1 Tax=Datura stramonium TaxID=4076 RepID=A0ABS8T7C4_DATST|nr:hypothetical protein [Datura stramonium]
MVKGEKICRWVVVDRFLNELGRADPLGEGDHPRWLDGSKCNTEEASRGNPGISSAAFCVRDSGGDLVYASGRRLTDTTYICAEALAIKDGIEYYMNNQLQPLIIEKDSLTMRNILEGTWETTWKISTIQFNTFQEMPSEARKTLNTNKPQIPSLRFRSIKRREPN